MARKRVTGYGVGSPKILLARPPIIAQRAPATSDINFEFGQLWVDQSTALAYILVAISAGSATWDVFAGSEGAVDTINSLSPTGGNIDIVGTSDQISIANASSTVTLSIPTAFIAPGSIEATTTIESGTTITAGTGITATTGDITATTGDLISSSGAVSADTTVTAGTGITATTGDITATAGDLVATAGAVSAGTTVTAGTGITATTGDITASDGDIVATAGAVTATQTDASRAFIGDTSAGTGVTATLTSSATTVDALQLSGGSISAPATTNTPGASPQVVNARTGQVAFTDVINAGAVATLTMTNSMITAASVIVANASCATVNSALNISTITPGAGTVDFVIDNLGSANTSDNILVNFWVIN